MKIVVCVKQVPEPGDIQVNGEGELEGQTGATMLNLFDTYAIEEALRIKENIGADVTALSLNTTDDVEVVKEAISYGVDDGVLIYDPGFEELDTIQAGFVSAKAVQKLGAVQLILTGKQSTDYGSGVFGVMLAQALNIPCFTDVKSIEILSENKAKIEIGWVGGLQTIVTVLPAVLSVSREINEPRMRTVKGMMKAKKAVMPVWDASDLGISANELIHKHASKRIKLEAPLPKQKCQIMDGSPDQQVEHLAELIQHEVV